MYKVIKKFADMEDRNHIYEIGDEYPREGYKPTDERIDFLASDQNKLGTPVIKAVPAKRKKKEPADESK